jgi:hypothetical protein
MTFFKWATSQKGTILFIAMDRVGLGLAQVQIIFQNVR